MLLATPGILARDWQRLLQAPPLPVHKSHSQPPSRVSILLSKGQFWELPQSRPQTRWRGVKERAAGTTPGRGCLLLSLSPSEEMRLLCRLRVRRPLRRDSSL